jgi:[acyl-carrier-protein] S-malonyltransferase
MANSGVSQFIEFGPGKVLTGLVKRISRDSTAMNVADLDSIEKATK